MKMQPVSKFCILIILILIITHIHGKDVRVFFKAHRTDPKAPNEKIKIMTTIRAGTANFGIDLMESRKIKAKVIQSAPFRACHHLYNADEAKGKIVIVERGDCSFLEKARLIESLGAKGGIILDTSDRSSKDDSHEFVMNCYDDDCDVSIPMVFLYSPDAQSLLQTMKEDPGLKVIISRNPIPLSSIQISDIMPTSVRVKWNCNLNPEDISNYVIKYKSTNANQKYAEITGIDTMSYTVRGLTSSTDYIFHVVAVDEFGRWPPSEAAHVTTTATGCGGEYSSSSGMIRHPLGGGFYQNSEKCAWIIRAGVGTIKFTIVNFDTERNYDKLYVRDGDSSDSALLHEFSGRNVSKTVQTSANAANLLFTSDGRGTRTGFELYWEPADAPIQTYSIPMHSDYEVRLNFSSIPRPTSFMWSYGPNFQDMPNRIQIPSRNEKFSSSLKNLKNGNYQARLRIAGITEEDIQTKFMLHVANNNGEANFGVQLYGCGGAYNSSIGMIRHPFNGGSYQKNESCSWVIKTKDRTTFTFRSFDTEADRDYLYIREGKGMASNFSGDNVPRSFQASTDTVYLLFTSEDIGNGTGFELHWEPAVDTFYQVLLHSDYEVRLNFSFNPQPTVLKWSYGATFQEMPNIIQVPSDNGKFSTSLIDLGNNKYQATLKIAEITEEDTEAKFMLHVENELYKTHNRFILSAFPHPPSLQSLQFSDITAISVQLEWDYNINPETISYYVIQYRPKNSDQDYTEISDIYTMFYTVLGLTGSTEYEFHVLAANKFGRGPPSEPSYVTTGCGGQYYSSSGVIRHPLRDEYYQANENCSWIITPADHNIKITFVRFGTEKCCDILTIRDGETIESDVLGEFSGENVTSSVQTHRNAAHLFFTSDQYSTQTGFELHWEPAVKTFYQIPLHSDYEVRINFFANSKPDVIGWSHAATFQEMPTLIPVPSYNGKFSTSLIDLENGKYQAFLRIAGITEEDYETKFKLHVVNEIGETGYKVMLSAFAGPPRLEISNITSISVLIAWDYNTDPGDISYYLIQYKPKNSDQDYTEISDILLPFYHVTGLMGSTEYEFRVLAVNNIGRGPPSEPSYFTTLCGGEYNSTRGIIRHPLSGDSYENNEFCTWIIRPADHIIDITFDRFDTEENFDFLYIQDGETIDSKDLCSFTGVYNPGSVQTSTNAAYLTFESDQWSSSNTGFELHWEPAVRTFYQIPMDSDYEVKLNFSADSEPTALEWSYGANFQEMPNRIQIPSDNGKFSTSLINLENGKYQALLRIAGITEEDCESRFKLHVENEIAETDYKVMLSAFPRPPQCLQISNITASSLYISWNNNTNEGEITYVIQYKKPNSRFLLGDVSGIPTNFCNVTYLMGFTEYEFRVLAQNTIGRGPPSAPLYVTTTATGCGGEYNSSSGKIRHPLGGGNYKSSEECTWIIKTKAHAIRITFISFETESWDKLTIRDGDNSRSRELRELKGEQIPEPVETTGNSAHLYFKSDSSGTRSGFEIQWEPAVIPIQTFYQIPMNSDYEVRVNFNANPWPSVLEWYYGPNFQEMYNRIQIPSDNRKFSTSIINLKDQNYQAILRIVGITKRDIDTKFKLHVANENVKKDYRIAFTALPQPPSLHISDIMRTSVMITCNYNVNQGDISYYVIQYKPRNADQDYTEISGLVTRFYTVRGLTNSTEYEFKVLTVNKNGRGPPSEPSYVTTTSCGGEYYSSSGTIRHSLNHDSDDDALKCTWIIRAAASTIDITIVSFDTEENYNNLIIRDGETSESKVLGKFSGNYIPRSVQTSTNAAHLFFGTNWAHKTGFELHWEPADAFIQTFYQIPIHSDYEVRFNFSANPQPTAIEWRYGPNFQYMPNLIQIPSDNRKFSASLIDLKNGNYQALLRIAGITKEDIETHFKLQVTNEIGETDYRVALSEFPHPPSLQISDIMPTSVRMTWNYNVKGHTFYVIRYKPRTVNRDPYTEYTEISGIVTNFYTVRGLTPSTQYEFHVLTEQRYGLGPPSKPSYVTTTSCGGEYNSSKGMIRHPMSGASYQNHENCTWIIRVPVGTVKITFGDFGINNYAKLYVRDGDSIESNVVKKYDRWGNKDPVQTTANVAHLLFTPEPSQRDSKPGFELHWEYADADIQTYNTPMHSNYEVRLNFSATPEPTALEWSYGPNFQEMPNLIQIPSNIGKFSTSLIDLENDNYQALLRIDGITEEDIETTFKLHVANEFGEADYRVVLYGCGGEYNTNSGMIRHPLSGQYKPNENCTWIIRAADRINISFTKFDVDDGYSDETTDFLYIQDGENIESNKLGRFTGNGVIPWPVRTSTNVAYLVFTSDHSSYSSGDGFELHWEPAAPLCDPKPPACSGLFTPVGDSCLLLATTEKLTWTAAREYCQVLGADLVVIKDANHYTDILGFIWRVNGDNAAIDLWIGGSDEAMEGNWIWITGETMPQGPPFWGSLDRFVVEPSGGYSENCAGLYHHDRYYMHDFACTLKHAPVCQKLPDSPICF